MLRLECLETERPRLPICMGASSLARIHRSCQAALQSIWLTFSDYASIPIEVRLVAQDAVPVLTQERVRPRRFALSNGKTCRPW